MPAAHDAADMQDAIIRSGILLSLLRGCKGLADKFFSACVAFAADL